MAGGGACYPDKSPYTFLVVAASGVDGPLTFSTDEIELFGTDGGDPLLTIRGSFEPETPAYANGYTDPTCS